MPKAHIQFHILRSRSVSHSVTHSVTHPLQPYTQVNRSCQSGCVGHIRNTGHACHAGLADHTGYTGFAAHASYLPCAGHEGNAYSLFIVQLSKVYQTTDSW